MKVESFGTTDVGRKRAHNEDSLSISDDLGLYLVADGMGGHNAGEVASSTAVETVTSFVHRFTGDKDVTTSLSPDTEISQKADVLVSAVRLANRQVSIRAREKYEYVGMGTTIVAIFIEEDTAHIANVGDSRAYLIRNSKIKQLTTDHSWINEQIQKQIIPKEDARNHRWRNVITRALGNKPDVEIDLVSVDLKSGDLLLLCTDGLSGMLEDNEQFQIISRSKGNLEKACKDLINAANERGGLDNITVILLKFSE